MFQEELYLWKNNMTRIAIMKYIKQIMWKLLQDKPKSESILKRLRSQTSREIGERPMTTTKTEAWTLLIQESQLYITEDNKVVDGSMDSIIYCKRQ